MRLALPSRRIVTVVLVIAVALLAVGLSATPSGVDWIPANGAAFSGSTLSGNATATLPETSVGDKAITSGSGFLDFGTSEADRAKAAGLGARDGKRGTAAIDFGFLLKADGTASILENGAVVQAAGSYSNATRFKVGVESGSIAFRVDGVLARTSALPFTYPLFAEATVLEDGATIYDAEVDGSVADVVAWAAAVSVNERPGQLSKNSLTASADSGAVSTMGIDSGGGYFEFRPGVDSENVSAGLSHGDGGQTIADIDFAIVFSAGVVEVKEGGTSKGTFGSYAASDVFRVAVSGAGTVTYLKNGSLFYTSLGTPTLPLLADTSLSSSGSGIRDAILSGDLEPTGVQAPTFSAGSRHLGSTLSVAIREATGGATIYYTTNGTEPTTGDTAISSGSTVSITSSTTLKAKAFASGLLSSTATAAVYSFGSTTAEAADWTNAAAVATASGEVLKDSVSTSFDAGAVSTKAIDSAAGYLEFQPSANSVGVVAGLSSVDDDQSIADVDFGIRLNAGGSIEISEGGTIRGSFGTYASTDVLRVSVVEGVVTYVKNGATVYTSLVKPRLPLLFDASIAADETGTTDVELSGVLVNSRTSAPVAAPTAGDHVLPITVSLSGDLGASIRYTTDGVTAPTTGSTLYATPISVSTATTIKSRSFKAGYLDSDVSTDAYSARAQAPVFTPGAGSYIGPLLVTATSSAPSVSIHYTLTGSTPTSGDPSISSGASIAVPSSSTLKAIAIASGYADSTVSSAAYDVVAPSPTFSPAPGTYVSTATITLSAAGGAAIRYTTNGDEPTTGSTLYSAPFAVSATTTVKAKAFVSGWSASATAVGAYDIVAAAPVLSPASGRWFTEQTIVATCATPGVTLRYTTDGTEPTGSSTALPSSGELLVDRAMAIKVRAFKTGVSTSASSRGSYIVTGQAAGGGAASFAVTAAGQLYAWGDNSWSRLGLGTSTSMSVPTEVTAFPSVLMVAAGPDHTLVLKADGTVWGVGSNYYGALGDGTTTARTTPVQVAGLPQIVSIAAGSQFGLALDSTGNVWGWGSNSLGQLGRGTTSTSETTAAVVPGLGTVVQLAAGLYYSIALKSDGSLVGFGLNWSRELGLASGFNYATPQAIPGLPPIVQIAAGWGYTLARTSTGELWGFGSGPYGQMGSSSLSPSLPHFVMSGVRGIAGAQNHTLVLGRDQRGRALGNGYLGWGDAVTRAFATPVADESPWFEVAAGDRHSMGIRMSGQLVTWGFNYSGQLGRTGTVETPLSVGLSLVSNSWAVLDDDLDGLLNGLELELGSDPFVADSNHDGVSDGDAFNAGLPPVSQDADGDGLSLDEEIYRGTDPFKADTDGDGTSDFADVFPLDPTQTTLTPTPGDTTPPVITLVRPLGAIPVS